MYTLKMADCLIQRLMGREVFDIIIIDGGIIGCSTAYHLIQSDAGLALAVIEKDPTYQFGSTSLSLGNIRIQFSLKENIQISQYAMKVLERFKDVMAVDNNNPFISFRREGNLFLVDPSGVKAAEKALALQNDLGCQVEWYSTKQIEKSAFPLYDPLGCQCHFQPK